MEFGPISTEGSSGLTLGFVGRIASHALRSLRGEYAGTQREVDPAIVKAAYRGMQNPGGTSNIVGLATESAEPVRNLSGFRPNTNSQRSQPAYAPVNG